MDFRRIRLFGLVFVSAAAVRVVTFPSVVTPIGVQFPLPGDLFYHLRRIWYSTVHFPAVIQFDPYVSFPSGGQIVWPPLFDWSIAGLARLAVGSASQGRFEHFVIWVPPVIGTLTAVLAAAMASRFFGLRGGAWAGGLLAVLPTSFVYTQLGQLDHHGAAALVTTSMLAVAMGVTARGARRRGAWAVALGLTMAASLLLWPGALIHVAVVQAGLGVWWLAAAERDEAVRRAWVLAAAHAVCAGALAPFALGRTWTHFGAWSPMVLSNFQPTYLAAVAVGAAGVAAAFARTPGGDGRPRRIALAGTVVLALPAAALLALPGLHEALVYAAHWFVRGEEFQRHVAELLPLFAMRGTFDPTFSIQRFGVVFLLFPIVWGRVAFLSWRRRSAPLALLALWSLVFFVLTLDQNRFGNTLVVAYAVSLGGVVAETWAALRAERPARKSLRVGVWVALALLALATVDSIVGFYRPRLAHALVALRDDGVRRAGPLSPRHRLFDRAARWMASGTPPTRGYLDTSLAPQYGVLCNWGVGHLVRYRSERPMVQDNFGVYGGRGTWEAAWRYYATPDEEEAVAILDRLGARYVMADFQGAGATRAAPWNSMIRLLYGNYGAETELPDGRLLPALSHHRLVFHAHTDARRDRGGPLRAEAPHRSIGVWERVAGARVTGRAEPGARVTARLDLETSRGRRHVYVIGTTADAGGVWSLVVPYSNGARFSSAVRVGEHYRLESAGNAATFVVSEQAVKRGLRVEGPDLRPDPDATGP